MKCQPIFRKYRPVFKTLGMGEGADAEALYEVSQPWLGLPKVASLVLAMGSNNL